MEGSEIDPSNSENYSVHLRIHIAALMQGIQQVEEGAVDLVEMTKQLYELFIHTTKTFEIAVVPEAQLEEMNIYKQQLQQIGEYINNGMRELQKMEREGEGQEQQGEANGDEVKSQLEQQKKQLEMQMKAESHMQKIQQAGETHAQKLALERQKALQDLAINDAKGAQVVRQKNQ